MGVPRRVVGKFEVDAFLQEQLRQERNIGSNDTDLATQLRQERHVGFAPPELYFFVVGATNISLLSGAGGPGLILIDTVPTRWIFRKFVMRTPKLLKIFLILLAVLLLCRADLPRQNTSQSPAPDQSPSPSPSTTPVVRAPSPTPLPGAQNFHQRGAVTVSTDFHPTAFVQSRKLRTA